MNNDRRRPRSFWPRRRSLWILFLLLPALTVMTLFVVWPLLSALRFAFYDFNGLLPSHFIGLENFRKVLFEEPYSDWTYNAFWHNVIVFVSLMIFENGTAFIVAFALLKGLPGHRIHQVIIFLPVVLSSVIVGFLWKLFLNPIFGLVNGALALIHIQGPAWLGNENTALGSIIFANVWHWLGFPTLVLLAGMQRISAEVIEAARLDGAGDYVLLRRIIWPLIAPSVTIVCILTFIGSFNWFEIPYVMAGLTGSPGGSTDVLGLYFYRTAFGSVTNGIQDFGQGSALAVLMFIFVAGFSFVALRFLRRREIQL
jgi:raffinose/stachyose/melibiose transport system permease protein